MKRPVRGLLAALTGGLLAVAGLSVTAAPAAHAEDNGVGAKPLLGWSSWSFVRSHPTAAVIEAQAKALKTSGLANDGYVYANVDDFWYHCPGSQGPDVDQYGRWVTDETKFPPRGDENGIQVVADYVHSLGLKFGLYVTPGISKQAVAQNTPIKGTSYHADDIATTTGEANYNCGGMVGIDYSKPGAQDFVNSWADQFAGWGIDYLKIDGVGTPDQQDVQAWSDALRKTGRPIHLELSNNLDINNAATWKKLANGWRTGGDIECYCGANGSSYPLTSWSSISSRFDQVAAWAPYGGPGGYNDYDSLEVGNGANDGLTPDERKTQMSLWSLAAAPLTLGTDLTHLDPADLALLKNRDVLGVDQDGIDAKRISSDGAAQVFAKTEPNGDTVVGLFNTGSAPKLVSAAAPALGLPAAPDYSLTDLWTHQATESAGTVASVVPGHGVALYRITPLKKASATLPPSTALTVGGLDAPTQSSPVPLTETFTDYGANTLKNVTLTLGAPKGAGVTPAAPVRFGSVPSGGTVEYPFTVTVPAGPGPFDTAAVTAKVTYTSRSGSEQATAGATVDAAKPVGSPYKTFASTTAGFGRSGTQLGIRAQGSDVYGSTNEYGAIYQPGAEHDGSTTVVKVTAQTNTDPWAKAGIMVRNDITNASGSPGFLILAVTPGNGYALQWDSHGNGQLDSNQSRDQAVTPVWLKLVRNGTTFTGSYSTDDSTWTQVGSVSVPQAAATQDVGVFATAHSAGSTGEADFDSFTTS
ncbi:NPCBM-associated, NEW3 domain of alpha-galactosidase [Actinacidiphila yanglinensis]|uniref:Alpha-galactosidase n=1 Tax=Actinacidiphila yanglinensis TaxID=310779 RepID=A0A1H6DG02_9ACTN|nr:NEW3 domain-containing protein [Actinacidiphila yanglinensis]SEG84150.1 NPCBM-associated, NEW3 domain of alpha-galactosidase [Actinacidiphila yanglinensis]